MWKYLATPVKVLAVDNSMTTADRHATADASTKPMMTHSPSFCANERLRMWTWVFVNIMCKAATMYKHAPMFQAINMCVVGEP